MVGPLLNYTFGISLTIVFRSHHLRHSKRWIHYMICIWYTSNAFHWHWNCIFYYKQDVSAMPSSNQTSAHFIQCNRKTGPSMRRSQPLWGFDLFFKPSMNHVLDYGSDSIHTSTITYSSCNDTAYQHNIYFLHLHFQNTVRHVDSQTPDTRHDGYIYSTSLLAFFQWLHAIDLPNFPKGYLGWHPAPASFTHTSSLYAATKFRICPW